MEETRQHSPVRIREKIQELQHQRERLNKGGGEHAIERQHRLGKLTARERIEMLLDPGTFKELNIWARPTKTGFDIDRKEAPGDALVMGYGKVDGRIIYVYAHDFTSLGGTQAAMQNWKVRRSIDMAVRMGVPYVGIVDSGGVRLQDAFGIASGRGISVLADVWYAPAIASGVVPGVTLLLGASYA
ncbi:MAG: carboxyl transferase domain-containing protein, partial [Thermodesulfobacteriota bacterium]|nr:carboxyl transferase domain-containing protein [Thermodesulfobacteriota bacterium]